MFEIVAHLPLRFATNLPRSCFRLRRLLQILTVQTERTMATMKKRMPPISPAVTALLLTLSGIGYLYGLLAEKVVAECESTRKM